MAEELALLQSLGEPDSVPVDAWQAVSHALRETVPASTFALWLDPLRPFAAAGETLTLAAPERIRAWTERRYANLIEEILRELTHYSRLQFVSAEEGS